MTNNDLAGMPVAACPPVSVAQSRDRKEADGAIQRVTPPLRPIAPRETCRISLLTTSNDADDWSAYVAAHPDATLFHELAWKQAVARAFGHRPHYLIARRGVAIVGVLPLFEIRSLVAGRLLVSMPYATYGGILADDTQSSSALFDRATKMATEMRVNRLELRSVTAAIPDRAVIESHATFQRELPTNLDDALTFLPRKARAAARQAEKRYALSVSFDPAEIETAWALYSRSMRRLASPNYPLRFFNSLRDALNEKLLVQIVRNEDRPVAALLSFLHRDSIMPYFFGLDERPNHYGLSHYVYQKCIEWGVAHGYRVFDFGRSRRDNAGASDFKRHCGFEPTILQYQAYTPPGRTPPDLSPASTKWSAARKIWRGLPLTITRPLGGWVAKSIPG